MCRLPHDAATTVVCSKCTAQMTLSHRKSILDGWVWRCPSSQCRTTLYIKKGSFFENVHISLSKYILVIYYWSQNVTSKNTVQFTGVSFFKSVGQILAFLREICSKQLIDNPTPPNAILESRSLLISIRNENFKSQRLVHMIRIQLTYIKVTEFISYPYINLDIKISINSSRMNNGTFILYIKAFWLLGSWRDVER